MSLGLEKDAIRLILCEHGFEGYKDKYTCICEGETSYFHANDKQGILILTKEIQNEKITMIFNCSRESRELPEWKGMQNLISENVFEGKIQAFETRILK